MIEVILDKIRDNDGTFSIEITEYGKCCAKIYAPEFIFEDGILSLFNDCGFEIMTINELQGVLKVIYNENGLYKDAYDYSSYSESE